MFDIDKIRMDMSREEFVKKYVYECCPSELLLEEGSCEDTCRDCFEKAIKDIEFKDDELNEEQEAVRNIIEEKEYLTFIEAKKQGTPKHKTLGYSYQDYKIKDLIKDMDKKVWYV